MCNITEIYFRDRLEQARVTKATKPSHEERLRVQRHPFNIIKRHTRALNILTLYLTRQREPAYLTVPSHGRNLLQTSVSRNDGIRCFLVDERLGDRVVSLFLLI